MDRTSIWESPLNRNKIDPFLKRVVIGYEKLISYLFLSMANDFADETLALREACENRLSQLFDNRDEDFYDRGFMHYLYNGNKLSNKTVYI